MYYRDAALRRLAVIEAAQNDMDLTDEQRDRITTALASLRNKPDYYWQALYARNSSPVDGAERAMHGELTGRPYLSEFEVAQFGPVSA